MNRIEAARAAYDAAVARMHEAAEAADLNEDAGRDEEFDAAFREAESEADRLLGNLRRLELRAEARAAHPTPEPATPPAPEPVSVVSEEPTYRPDRSHSFFRDV